MAGIREIAERKGKSRTIVLNFSDFDTLYYLDILHGISDYAYAKGYSLLISTGENFPNYAIPEICCGCIVIDVHTEDSDLKRIADRGLPVITLDREIHYPHVKSIVVNNYASEKQLIEGLIEGGYRRFAFLGGLDTADNRERYTAFRDALKEHGISFGRKNYYEGDWREKSGAHTARLLMLSEEMPEALICANDMMAIGAIRKFHENGIRIPDDIGIAGFDDIILSKAHFQICSIFCHSAVYPDIGIFAGWGQKSTEPTKSHKTTPPYLLKMTK